MAKFYYTASLRMVQCCKGGHFVSLILAPSPFLLRDDTLRVDTGQEDIGLTFKIPNVNIPKSTDFKTFPKIQKAAGVDYAAAAAAAAAASIYSICQMQPVANVQAGKQRT